MIASSAFAVGAYLGLALGLFLIGRQIYHVSTGRGRFYCVYCKAPLVNAYAKVCAKCGRDQPATRAQTTPPSES